MSYFGLDPAGPFDDCPICRRKIDITAPDEHRDCQRQEEELQAQIYQENQAQLEKILEENEPDLPF